MYLISLIKKNQNDPVGTEDGVGFQRNLEFVEFQADPPNWLSTLPSKDF